MLAGAPLTRRAALLWLTGAAALPAWAQMPEVALEASEAPLALAPERLLLQREGDSLLLSSELHWQLPEPVVDALTKGIPVHFVSEVQVLRERWYWSDQELLSARRYLRLSYQPLTRRWRLHQAATPFEGSSLGVGTSYTELREALGVMQRIVRWRIGPAQALPTSGEVLVALRLRIDLSQFPRPLQIGALGQPGWNALVTRTQRLAVNSL